MSYAVKKDLTGWRAVNSIEDIDPIIEYFSETTIEIQEPVKTKQEKLQELAEQYNTDLFSLQRAWLSAAVADGINEGTRKEAIEAEIDELKAEYLENRATIEAEG